MKTNVKILVVGDDGVGKSSLISSYISRHFPPEVPAVMSDTIIPSEKTANNVLVTIMDSSSRSFDRELLSQKILIADSILLLYDVTRPETFDSLSSEWLPMIKDVQDRFNSTKNTQQQQQALPKSQTSPQLMQSSEIKVTPIQSQHQTNGDILKAYKPVIIVGTKIDLLSEGEDISKHIPLLSTFPFVSVGSVCSAATLQDVDDVFYFSEQAVTSPLYPLFDVQMQEFTPACRRAFRRIFRIFDTDNDNLLNDKELCEVQFQCFQAGGTMNAEELKTIKQLISKTVPEGLKKRSITFEGFLGLVRKFVDNNNSHLPWTILWRFNYDDDLQLMVPPSICSVPKLRPDQTTELSPSASRFLLGLARNASLDVDKPVQEQLLKLKSSTVPSSSQSSSSSSSSSQSSQLPNPSFASSDSTQELETDSSIGSSPNNNSNNNNNNNHNNSSNNNNNCSSRGADSMSWDALQSVFLSVLPQDAKHPWLNPPVFSTSIANQSMLLPRFTHIGANISFTAWLTQWNLLAMSNPAYTQDLLYRLGYAHREDNGVVPSAGTVALLSRRRKEILSKSWCSFISSFFRKSTLLPQKSIVKVCVLGGDCVGKSSFVWNLSGLRAPGSFDKDVEKGVEYAKSEDCIVVGGLCSLDAQKHHASNNLANNIDTQITINDPINSGGALEVSPLSGSEKTSQPLLLQAHNLLPKSSECSRRHHLSLMQTPHFVCLSAIPFQFAMDWLSQQRDSCDLFVLMFQCGDADSLRQAIELEGKLPAKAPRMFVGSKIDLIERVVDSSSESSFVPPSSLSRFSEFNTNNSASEMRWRILMQNHEAMQSEVEQYTAASGLTPAVLVSSKSGQGMQDAIEAILKCCDEPESFIPSKTRRKDSWRLTSAPPPPSSSTPTTTSSSSSSFLYRYRGMLFVGAVALGSMCWITFRSSDSSPLKDVRVRFPSWLKNLDLLRNMQGLLYG